MQGFFFFFFSFTSVVVCVGFGRSILILYDTKAVNHPSLKLCQAILPDGCKLQISAHICGNAENENESVKSREHVRIYDLPRFGKNLKNEQKSSSYL